MRPVRIEGQHVLTARLLEACPVCAAETGQLLADQPRVVLADDLLGAVGRAAVDHDDLAGRPQSRERAAEHRQDPFEVRGFVQGRDHEAERAAG